MKIKHLIARLPVYVFIMAAGLVSCKGKVSDADIQTEVNKKLADEAGSALTASVSNGVVTLTGTCKDDACKTSCANEVKEVKGVTSVVNNITLPPPPAPDAAVVISPDPALQEAVNGVVKTYSKVKADVKDGVVTLTGEIERAKLQDLMMALNALNPKKVDNQLTIK